MGFNTELSAEMFINFETTKADLKYNEEDK